MLETKETRAYMCAVRDFAHLHIGIINMVARGEITRRLKTSVNIHIYLKEAKSEVIQEFEKSYDWEQFNALAEQLEAKLSKSYERAETMQAYKRYAKSFGADVANAWNACYRLIDLMERDFGREVDAALNAYYDDELVDNELVDELEDEYKRFGDAFAQAHDVFTNIPDINDYVEDSMTRKAEKLEQAFNEKLSYADFRKAIQPFAHEISLPQLSINSASPETVHGNGRIAFVRAIAEEVAAAHISEENVKRWNDPNFVDGIANDAMSLVHDTIFQKVSAAMQNAFVANDTLFEKLRTVPKDLADNAATLSRNVNTMKAALVDAAQSRE